MPTFGQSLPSLEQRGFGTLHSSTRWSGEVWLRGDIVVPQGAVLEIEAGTRLYVGKVSAWKFDFERPGDRGQWFGSPARCCAIVVYGELRVAGTQDKPVVFLPEGESWGGIVLLGKSSALIKGACLNRADRACVSTYDRSCLHLEGCQVTQSRSGIAAGGLSKVSLTESVFSENEWGCLAYDFVSVSADRSRFEKNDFGIRADDRACLKTEGCAFRFNRQAGILAQGRCRVRATENGFEENKNFAVGLQENSVGFFHNNRMFHNETGYTASGHTRLDIMDDKIGPNQREGISVQGFARARLRRAFIHGHAASPGLKAHESANVFTDESRFFGNSVGMSLQGRSRWIAKRSLFQGSVDAGVRCIGTSRGRLELCQFTRNHVGADFQDGSRVRLVGNHFAEQESQSVHVKGTAEARLVNNLFKESGIGCEVQDQGRLLSRSDRWMNQRVHGILARLNSEAWVRGGHFETNVESAIQGLDSARVAANRSRFLGNGVGIGVSGSATAKVVGNNIQSQRREGFISSSEGRCFLKGNTFIQNNIGASHSGGDKTHVTRNRFWRHEVAGVCAGSAVPWWVKNRFFENRIGLDCCDESKPVVLNNRFEKSQEAALHCVGNSSPRLRSNLFRGNVSDCLYIAPSRPADMQVGFFRRILIAWGMQ